MPCLALPCCPVPAVSSSHLANAEGSRSIAVLNQVEGLVGQIKTPTPKRLRGLVGQIKTPHAQTLTRCGAFVRSACAAQRRPTATNGDQRRPTATATAGVPGGGEEDEEAVRDQGFEEARGDRKRRPRQYNDGARRAGQYCPALRHTAPHRTVWVRHCRAPTTAPPCTTHCTAPHRTAWVRHCRVANCRPVADAQQRFIS